MNCAILSNFQYPNAYPRGGKKTMKQKSFYRAPLLTASTVTLLTALLFIFQNFDLPTYAVPPVTWVPGSEYFGVIQVTTADHSPFRKVQIRVIEGPTDLLRLYRIGYVTNN